MQGAASRSELLALSDLSRPALAAFRERWSVMPDDERERIMSNLLELAESSVDVNFNRVFREALADPIPRVRQLALEGLWEDEGRDLPEIYLRILQSDPDDDVRAEAASALQRCAEEFNLGSGGGTGTSHHAIADNLVAIAGSGKESPLVRRRCIEALGMFAGDPRAIALIRAAAVDDDQTIAAGAIRAMGSSRQSRWNASIEQAMQSPDAEMRFEAAAAAGMMGESDFVEGLAMLVEDEDAEVQAAAIGALGRIGGGAATRVLRNLLESGFIDDIEMVQDALDEASLADDSFGR